METYERMVEGHPIVDADNAVKGKLYYIKTRNFPAGEVSKSFLGQLVDFREGTIGYSPYLTFAVVNPNDLTSSLGKKSFEGKYIRLFDLPDDILPSDRNRDKRWAEGKYIVSEEEDDDSGSDFNLFDLDVSHKPWPKTFKGYDIMTDNETDEILRSDTSDYIPAGIRGKDAIYGKNHPLYKKPVDTPDSDDEGVEAIAQAQSNRVGIAPNYIATRKRGRREPLRTTARTTARKTARIEGGKRKRNKRKSNKRKSVRRKKSNKRR